MEDQGPGYQGDQQNTAGSLHALFENAFLAKQKFSRSDVISFRFYVSLTLTLSIPPPFAILLV